MPPEYFSPTYLDEALELMASRSLDLVAGGTDFFPARGRTPVTRDILDITRLGEERRFLCGDLRLGGESHQG